MNFKSVFLGLRKFSNLSVLHKGLLMQDRVFRLGTQLNFRRKLSTKSIIFQKLLQDSKTGCGVLCSKIVGVSNR